MVGVLKGVVMELEDCALPLLKEVKCSGDPMEGFADIDVAILVGAMPRKEGMERADLLKANANIFKVQGAALDKVAKKSVKVREALKVIVPLALLLMTSYRFLLLETQQTPML